MIHQYKNNGYNIVLDVNSGSIHVVDDVAYDVIGMYETKERAEITAEILKKYPEVKKKNWKNYTATWKKCAKMVRYLPKIRTKMGLLISKKDRRS